MKLNFYGADRCVTGSCHGLEVNGKKILIDCGLQQGRDEISNPEFPFNPPEIDCVLVTHAHIDHSGRLPLLVKQGFRGRILTTRITADLLEIMLLDSAYIQVQDAEWKNRKAERSGMARVEPLYTPEDAEAVMQYMTTCEYGQIIDLYDGVEVEFVDAGHLLGSSCIAMELTENGVRKRIVFSGDLGNVNQPIIRDPVHFHGADYVVMESTYGDRNHTGVWSYRDNLAVIIDETMARGGNLIIPSFAVGRTQELLYFIREIKDAHEVKSKPDFEVYIDSPLARRATEIFKGDLLDYLDNDAFQLVKGGTHMFSFDGLRTTESVEESRELNTDPTPKVILSASGMCEAGRIRHHLKHNLWRPECTILFVGYQGEGTLGRTLLEGAESVKLFGEEIAVHAKIMNLQGMSSHADRDHLLEWITDFTSPKPQQVFVVHGDREVAPYFAQSLNARGIPAHAPQYTEVYDLVTNTMLQPGNLPARTPKVSGSGRFSAPYERLVKMGQILNESIKRSKGRDNKSLARFADQLKQLLEKWEA
ncbi:MAG: MBL fold metallo-hydrolase [Oscillibacter sp.]|nr:MBL fold metallo-hydrolase [Oscillibacter sp.]